MSFKVKELAALAGLNTMTVNIEHSLYKEKVDL